MRLNFIAIIVLTIFSTQWGLTQLSFPLEDFYQSEIERRFLKDTSAHSFYSQHLSSRPIRESRTQSDSVYADYSKQYYWLTQKLFKENFLIFKGEDFWCAVDPVVDLEMGNDFGIDSFDYKFWNTRGIRVQAKFFDKVGFVTEFYETQARVPDYQKEFFQSHGEFVLSGGLTTYKQVNAVVPGFGRTKTFKTTGFDFAFAQGYFSIEPNKYFNLQFGNGNHFIGNGSRSLLLSDMSTNYPFLKMETNFLDNRIQYQVMYALLTNLYRVPFHTTPEATYERKIGSFHFLDFAVTKNLTIGLFEGAVWKHTDSLGTGIPDPMFANPLILVGSIAKSNDNDTSAYNSIIGLNVNFNFYSNSIYGQLVYDNQTISAWQAGIKTYDFLVPFLDISAEYNHAEQNSYLSNNKRYNYAHYNLPLAHPLVGGFDEILFRVSYQYKRWFFQNSTVYYTRYQNDSINIGTDILSSSASISFNGFDRSKIFYNQFEAGYRFNKRYNLQAVAGFIFRTGNEGSQASVTNFVYLGIRTRLKNKRFDY